VGIDGWRLSFSEDDCTTASYIAPSAAPGPYGEPFSARSLTFAHVNGGSCSSTSHCGVGDNVLVAVADCLRRELRGHDGLGRYGGEEFVIILDRLDLGAAHQVADRLRAAVSALHVVDGLQITVSIGLAHHQSEHGPVDLNQLLTRADTALYQAKSSDRGGVQTY